MATQSEGYGIQSNLDSLLQKSALENLNPCNTKIAPLRPIPSKTSTGLNFIATPSSSILVPSNHTSFKSLSAKLDNNNDNQIESNLSMPSTSQITDTNIDKEITKGSSTSQSNTDQIQSDSNNTVQKTFAKQTKDVVQNDEKVVIDIASCDGPVRFRRVLNETYGSNFNGNSKVIGPNEDNFTMNKQCLSASFHQQMVRNINDSLQKMNSEAQQSGESYSCVYCNHTFKSQYCYQKHAKRHLNPLSFEGDSQAAAESADNESDKEVELTETLASNCTTQKREVKPLDMNVQYYPCKTCGSKFPSYYFVHKHRKLCHSEEEII